MLLFNLCSFLVLEFVTLLSDPDNLNHLIVSQLDQKPLETMIEETPDADRDISSSELSESTDA